MSPTTPSITTPHPSPRTPHRTRRAPQSHTFATGSALTPSQAQAQLEGEGAGLRQERRGGQRKQDYEVHLRVELRVQ